MITSKVKSAKHVAHKPASRRLKGGKALAIALALSLGTTGLFGTAAFSDEGDVLLIAPAPSASQGAAEYEKTEVVYATLSAEGAPEAMYVVNRFEVEQPGSVEDFGSYDAVRNLTNGSILKDEDGKVVFDVEQGVFFYQGDMNTASAGNALVELPWTVNIEYELDGESVDAADLAGQSGELTIHVETLRNDKGDASFFDSYMLQITFTLDGDLCSEVKADGATMAMSGRDRTVAFTVLPGSEGDFSLSAKVKDFEMSGAQIVALPYAMVMDLPDTGEMMEGMDSLSSAITKLNDGASSLAAGIDALTSGASDLASGASEFGKGLDRLDASADEIVAASSKIDGVLDMVAEELAAADLSGLDQLGQLSGALRQLADGLDGESGLAPQVVLVKNGLAQAQAALDQYMADLPTGSEISEGQFSLLLETALRADASDGGKRTMALSKLIDYYAAAATARAVYFGYNGAQGAQAAFAGAGTLVGVLTADSSTQGSLAYFASLLRQMADGLDGAFDASMAEQLNTLVNGMQELSTNYSKFHEGLVSFAAGLGTLNFNYGSLESGVSNLAYGTGSLSNGAWQLSNGVGELNENTIDLPDELRAQVEELMADYEFPEFEPRSFVSELNQNTVAVQFVMTTSSITVPEAPVVEEPEEEKLTIWDRFLNLFR